MIIPSEKAKATKHAIDFERRAAADQARQDIERRVRAGKPNEPLSLPRLIRAVEIPMSDERLYLTLLAVSRDLDCGKISRILKSCSGFNAFPDDGANFNWIYENAYNIFYNSLFAEKFTWSHLGSLIETDVRSSARLRADFVLLEADQFDTRALHIHLAPLDVLPGPGSSERHEYLERLILLTQAALYPKPDQVSPGGEVWAPEAVLQVLDSLRDKTRRKRSFALPFSSYFYFSWCNLEPSSFATHAVAYRKDIYRLLLLHNKGVDDEVAKQHLGNDKWATTEFFVNYFQPGGMVSVSKPHDSRLYDVSCEHRDWFLPTPEPATSLWDSGRSSRIARSSGRDESYDWTPEYPPLRYLGLLSLEFVGFYEEALRGIYEDLISMQQMTAALKAREIHWLRRYIGGAWRSLKSFPDLLNIELRFAQLNNFEYLRLPVSRGIIDRLIIGKKQENIVESIRSLKASNLNAMVFLLTGIALVVAIVPWVPGLVQAAVQAWPALRSFLGLQPAPAIDL